MSSSAIPTRSFSVMLDAFIRDYSVDVTRGLLKNSISKGTIIRYRNKWRLSIKAYVKRNATTRSILKSKESLVCNIGITSDNEMLEFGVCYDKKKFPDYSFALVCQPSSNKWAVKEFKKNEQVVIKPNAYPNKVIEDEVKSFVFFINSKTRSRRSSKELFILHVYYLVFIHNKRQKKKYLKNRDNEKFFVSDLKKFLINNVKIEGKWSRRLSEFNKKRVTRGDK